MSDQHQNDQHQSDQHQNDPHQSEKASTSLWVSCLSALCSAGVHLYLTLHYYQLKAGAFTGQSACNINQTFNCDVVSLSSYAQIFTTPIALLGMVTALMTIVFILIYQWNMTFSRQLLAKAISTLTALTLLASLVMAVISFTKLNTYCLFCLITYALSIVTFIGVWRGLQGVHLITRDDLKSFIGTSRWITVCLLLIPGAGLLGNQMFRHHYKLDKIEEFIAEAVFIWQGNPVESFSSRGLKSQKNLKNPKITVVEFADFKCGHCQQAVPVFAKFKKSHPDVQFIFKSYALDGTCNSAITDRNGEIYIGDGTRCLLAQLTYCADKQEKGWQFHDWIFNNSNSLYSKTEIETQARSFASTQGIHPDKLISCMNSQEAFEEIKKQTSEGSEAGISGTPSTFINGRKVPGGQSSMTLEAIYRILK